MAEALQLPTNQDGDLPTAHPKALWAKSEVWCGNGYSQGWAREKLFPLLSFLNIFILWVPWPTEVDKKKSK